LPRCWRSKTGVVVISMARRLAILGCWAALLGCWTAAHAQCLAPLMNPDDGYAISPFGVDRSNTPGASAGWHLGIDLQKTENVSSGANKTSPLYAPVNGTVTVQPNAAGAGNKMVFKRADGTQIEFLHMERYAPKFMSAQSMPVTSGEYVGELGGTGGPYAKHLHLQMKIPTTAALDYRDKMFAAGPGAKSKSNSPFTADKLSSGYQPSSGMVFVDPQYWLNRQFAWNGNMAKYTSQGFTMAAGNQTQPATCAVTAGSPEAQAHVDAVNAMGGQDPSTMTANDLVTKGFKDGDIVGAIDAPPHAAYADMSEQDVVATEAGRRMTDVGWALQLTNASPRGLTMELARIRAATLWIHERIAEKKERIEVMMAAFLALRVKAASSAAAAASGR
jgi:hypothetical protein